MNPNSKIYVAGHRGLVGSAILRRLQQEGYTNLITRSHRELNLTDQTAVNAFFKKEQPEYVFLAAARVGGIWANDTFPAEFIRDNLLIQTNVIDAAHRSGVRKLLFLGSSCIYPRMTPQPMKEEHLLAGPLELTNQWYAIAKIAGIKMCQAYRRQYGFNTVAIMPTNLYGPGDNYNLQTSHVLPALIRKFYLAKLALQGDRQAIEEDKARYGPIPEGVWADLLAIGRYRGDDSLPPASQSATITLWGTGTPRREFLHVDDLAGACLFLMERYESEEIINVGVGEDLSIRELAETIRDVAEFKGNIVFDASKPDGTPRKLLDISRISSLGWNPQINLKDGIEQTYSDYLQSRSLE